MEGASIPASGVTVEVPDKGLKKDAIGFLSNVVIGVASTAPAYSSRPRSGSSSRSAGSASTRRRC